MKKITGLFFLSLSYSISFSQDAIVRKLQSESLRPVSKDLNDSTWKTWKLGGMYRVSVGQGSQSNWSAGGDDFSFTIATSLNLFGFYKNKKHSWDNVIDLSFGYLNTTSLGSRKNDDRFDLLSKYGYSLSKKLNLTTLGNFRSQFLAGYNYKDDTKSFASAFLSPAYVIVSQGLDYKPTKTVSVFISPVTSRWVLVANDSLSLQGNYGIAPGKHSSNQVGAFATINYQQPFGKNICYKGRLDVFSNYKSNALKADMYMTNIFSAKVGKIIAFSWNVDMIYDDDVKYVEKTAILPSLQIKSMIGVGLQVKI